MSIMPDRFNSTSAPQVAASATGTNGLTTACARDPWTELRGANAEIDMLRAQIGWLRRNTHLTVAEALHALDSGAWCDPA